MTTAPFLPDLNPFASPFAALSDLEEASRDGSPDRLALSMDALNAMIGLREKIETAHADHPSRASAAILAVVLPLLDVQLDRLTAMLDG